ncbi:hypothetical protein Hdeb2414_s0022g00621061 [Helianthus debilis subsp. tardiflorus]
MEQMLEKSCYDMVVKDGYTDPEIIRVDIYNIRGKIAVLDISMQDNPMVVPKAGVPTATIPATPYPKTTTTKSRTPDSPVFWRELMHFSYSVNKREILDTALNEFSEGTTHSLGMKMVYIVWM